MLISLIEPDNAQFNAHVLQCSSLRFDLFPHNADETLYLGHTT